MKTDTIRPTSLVGIKKLAKQIKKTDGIPHQAALDLAARAASFANYQHAHRQLITEHHTVYITAYWLSDDGFRGRETLKIETSRPVLCLATRSQFRATRGLSDMRLVADDHFVCDSLYPTRDSARRQACMAARTLQFINVTGLLPSREDRKRRRKVEKQARLPGMDHPSDWHDPVGNQYILVDEPYLAPEDRAEERQQWARKYGWDLQVSTWAGMYYPHMTTMYLACERGSGPGLARILATLQKAPPPVTELVWVGDSADDHATFISPAARTPQDVRRAKSVGTIRRRRSARTAPYQLLLGGRNRRPLPRLPLEAHIKIARLLHSVLSDEDWEVYRRLDSIRCTLDDWAQVEYNRRDLSDEIFHTMYYGEGLGEDDPERISAATIWGKISNLEAVRGTLTHNYRDSAPLRSVLQKLDGALSRLKSKV